MGKTDSAVTTTDSPVSAKFIQRPGFDKEGKAYPGVDPATGERKTVTLEGLRKEYGKAEGERVYREVAIAGGFYNPDITLTEYEPDLAIHGLKGEQKEEVERILASAEPKQ